MTDPTQPGREPPVFGPQDSPEASGRPNAQPSPSERPAQSQGPPRPEELPSPLLVRTIEPGEDSYLVAVEGGIGRLAACGLSLHHTIRTLMVSTELPLLSDIRALGAWFYQMVEHLKALQASLQGVRGGTWAADPATFEQMLSVGRHMVATAKREVALAEAGLAAFEQGSDATSFIQLGLVETEHWAKTWSSLLRRLPITWTSLSRREEFKYDRTIAFRLSGG